MRTTDPQYQWRHQLQAGIETARVVLDQLTPYAAKLTPLLQQWHQVGLTQDSSSCLRLTNEGRFWASNIFQSLQELIAELNLSQSADENTISRSLS